MMRDVDTRPDPRKSEPGGAPGSAPYLEWANVAETALRAEIDAPVTNEVAPLLLALILEIQGEEFAARGNWAEAEKKFAPAWAQLARDAGRPGAPLHLRFQLTIMEIFRAGALKVKGKHQEADSVLAGAGKDMRQLANEDWGQDLDGLKNRTRLCVGIISKLRGEFVVRTDPKAATGHYLDAFDAFDKVVVKPGRYEVSLRMSLFREYGEIGVSATSNGLGVPVARAAFAGRREQSAKLGPLLGHPGWLTREGLHAEVLLAGFDALDGKDTFRQLDDATTALVKFAKDNPTDEQARLQSGTALVVLGPNKMVKGRWEEGRADTLSGLNILREFAPRSDPARYTYRASSALLAQLAVQRGFGLLAEKPPKRQLAQEWAEAGLKALDDAAKVSPLTAEEKKIRAALEAVRKRAAP
jgi:hypothetical protein